MINFNKIIGPGGIPVYHQRLPGVGSVSMRWVMFVGAADDTTIGSPGLFHWFEHVPFRGTKKFPNGTEVMAEIARHGGNFNANTSTERTQYLATAPLGNWRKVFEFITDLMCQPLLREEDVDAERTIIGQEISDSLSDSDRLLDQKIRPIIWGNHPFKNEVLGTEESMNSMSVSLLRKAHELYSRSRCVLFVAGDISEMDVLSALEEMLSIIPDRPLSERRAPISYGIMPTLESGIDTFESPLPGSEVLMIYQTPRNETVEDIECFLRWQKLRHLMMLGGMNAPLIRTVRVERKLVYGTGVTSSVFVDGGYCGFGASAKTENIPKIIEAFKDVLRLPELRTDERHEYVHDFIRGDAAMHVIDPGAYTGMALGQLLSVGQVQSQQKLIQKLTSIPRTEIDALLDTLTPERARVFILQGKGY